CPPPATAQPIFRVLPAAKARVSFFASPGGVVSPLPGGFFGPPPRPGAAAAAGMVAAIVLATAPAVRISRRLMVSPSTSSWGAGQEHRRTVRAAARSQGPPTAGA